MKRQIFHKINTNVAKKHKDHKHNQNLTELSYYEKLEMGVSIMMNSSEDNLMDFWFQTKMEFSTSLYSSHYLSTAENP